MKFAKCRFVLIDISSRCESIFTICDELLGNYFGVGAMFWLQKFSHAVMASSREGSWLDGSMTSRATCCLFFCSREIPRWCRLSGVSQEAITFQSENKLTGL